MKIALWTALAGAALVAAACRGGAPRIPLPPPQQLSKVDQERLPPPGNEHLEYRILAAGVPAGSLILNNRVRDGEIQSTLRARTTGAFELVHPVRVEVTSRRQLDAAESRLSVRVRIRQRTEVRHLLVRPEESRLHWQFGGRSGPPHRVKNHWPLDPLGLLWRLRTGPVIATPKNFEVTTGRRADCCRITPLGVGRFHIGGQEVAASGFRLETLPIFAYESPPVLGPKWLELTLWIEQTPPHRPLHVEVPWKLGALTLELLPGSGVSE